MTKEELSNIVEDATVKIMNDNVDYINEHHEKEMEQALKNNQNPINRTFQSFLHSAITLSTLTTLKTLKDLGVDSLKDLEL